MYVKVDSIKDLKEKINACKKLCIGYELSGKVIPCDIDLGFYDEDGIIYCTDETPQDVDFLVPKRHSDGGLTKKLYNFDKVNLKFKTLTITKDAEGKIREKEIFIVTDTFYGKKYFKLCPETELSLFVKEYSF